jgi:hypothetical protein
MSDLGASLLSVFDFAWERLFNRMDGLTDEEYFWEPVPGCWTLRRGSDGRWRLDDGHDDHDDDDGASGRTPELAPVTTIAWRVGHVGGMALGGFTDRRFPDLALGDVDLPARAGDAAVFMEQNYSRWRQGMESLDNEQWWEPLGASWGPYADDSSVDLALHVLDELVHHGAEVALLRDLYAHRADEVTTRQPHEGADGGMTSQR